MKLFLKICPSRLDEGYFEENDEPLGELGKMVGLIRFFNILCYSFAYYNHHLLGNKQVLNSIRQRFGGGNFMKRRRIFFEELAPRGEDSTRMERR